MKCEELLAMLNEYVDGEIDPGVCEQFEKHLVGCNPCQVVVDNIRKTITLYKAGEVYELVASKPAAISPAGEVGGNPWQFEIAS